MRGVADVHTLNMQVLLCSTGPHGFLSDEAQSVGHRLQTVLPESLTGQARCRAVLMQTQKCSVQVLLCSQGST